MTEMHRVSQSLRWDWICWLLCIFDFQSLFIALTTDLAFPSLTSTSWSVAPVVLTVLSGYVNSSTFSMEPLTSITDCEVSAVTFKCQAQMSSSFSKTLPKYTLFRACLFSDINNSVMCLMYGGIFIDHFIATFLPSVLVNKIEKCSVFWFLTHNNYISSLLCLSLSCCWGLADRHRNTTGCRWSSIMSVSLSCVQSVSLLIIWVCKLLAYKCS